jgi:hypothetical protein
MASTDKLVNANPYAAAEQHPAHAAGPDQTYPVAATAAIETHRRGPERRQERPQTRSEYIEHVLAQIKGIKGGAK